MLNINEYLLEYKRRIPNMLFMWTIILTFIIICLIIINQTVIFKDYYKVEGVVKNKNVSIYVLIKDLDSVINNNQLYIKNNKYIYKIKEISEELTVSDMGFYKEVLLSINMDTKYLVENNVMDIRFVVREMTIFEYIINLIKGE